MFLSGWQFAPLSPIRRESNMFSKPCVRCGVSVFAKYQSQLDLKRFCRECGVREGARQKDRKVEKKCVICGKTFKVKESKAYLENSYIHCSMKCAQVTRIKKVSGPLHPRWRETKAKQGGYVSYKKDGKTRYVHRDVMEEFLGRKLRRDEIVHHKNHNRKDNRVENLELMTNSEHVKMHFIERGSII